LWEKKTKTGVLDMHTEEVVEHAKILFGELLLKRSDDLSK
jgi:hypothetical protein